MANKKLLLIIISCSIFIGILIIIYKLYKDFSVVDKTMQPIMTSIPLQFEDLDQTIYINTKVWGLLGDHSCIFISDKEKDFSMEDIDFLFKNTVLYYKVQYPDSLFIFLPSMSYSEEKKINKTFGNIKINITEFKASKNKEYRDGYEKMGLAKIEAN